MGEKGDFDHAKGEYGESFSLAYYRVIG